MKKFYTSVSLVLSLCILTCLNATPASTAPLPADLLYFKGYIRQFVVTLEWGVTADSGLVAFEILRSPDNLTFEPIGQVAAVHTGDPRERYYYTDMSPIYTGTGYYKLNFVMSNGERILQDAYVRINYQSLPPILAFPNPAWQKMNISVNDADRILITTMTGELVTELEPGQTEVDVQNIPPGSYVVRALHGEVWQSKVITIQR